MNSSRSGVVVFLGCDGSGKSSVIEALKSQLEAKGFLQGVYHWRPSTPCRESSTSPTEASEPHASEPRGGIASFLKLGALWVEWWLFELRVARRARRKGKIILFDRFYGDMLVDPLRYRYGGGMGLLRLWERTMPRVSRIIFLDAPPEVLLERKQEVAAGALARSRDRYHELVDRELVAEVVDATQSIGLVVDSVCRILDLDQDAK